MPLLKFRPWAPTRSKYNAKKTIVDGITFDSKKEAKYYTNLSLAKKTGDITLLLRQVPFHLPGGVTYKLDFMILWKTGAIEFVDVKGFKTKEYIIKKKLVESIFNIEITEV